MAAVASSGVCRGCGARRGVDHCQGSMPGPALYLFNGAQPNPGHPCNNGQFDELVKALKNKKSAAIEPLSDEQIKAVVLFPGDNPRRKELTKRSFRVSRSWLRKQQGRSVDELTAELQQAREQKKQARK